MPSDNSDKHLPGPGFCIEVDFTRPLKDKYSMLASYATADISDQLNGLYTLDPAIKPHGAGNKVCGPCFTVKLPPGDNLMLHKALEVAQPGDVIVVDGGGQQSRAQAGEMVAQKAKHKKIAAIVVDGLIRDLESVEESDFTIFAKGVTPLGPTKNGPGEINTPINCGGIVIHPGDIVIGDEDGLVVVPQQHLNLIIERMGSWKEATSKYIENVRKGKFDFAWVNKKLSESGLD